VRRRAVEEWSAGVMEWWGGGWDGRRTDDEFRLVGWDVMIYRFATL
jgi:hypothetical protein